MQQIQSSHAAFAAILGDGSVVTWGDADFGGNSSAVQHQLRDVQQIQANTLCFAATWADARFGGGSIAVQEQLTNVRQIQAACGTCAAILDDGPVVTWGADPSLSLLYAFAAILGDESVVTWGRLWW